MASKHAQARRSRGAEMAELTTTAAAARVTNNPPGATADSDSIACARPRARSLRPTDRKRVGPRLVRFNGGAPVSRDIGCNRGRWPLRRSVPRAAFQNFITQGQPATTPMIVAAAKGFGSAVAQADPAPPI